MSLFVVRPSRGTWAFFGLVVLGVLGTRAMRQHEARVIRQDRPASERVHELAACVLGSNVAWVLREPDAPDAQLRWTHDASRVLRALVSRPQPDGWPRACVEVARGLSLTLLRTSTSSIPTRTLSVELRDLLERASNPDEALALADGDQIAAKLAALLLQVRALSNGSRATWDGALVRTPPPFALTMAPVPALRGLPGAVEHPVLVDPQTVLARGTWNGYGQVLRVDGGRPRRVLFEPSTPLPEPAHAGLARLWLDDGPRLLSLAPRPALLAMPEGFAVNDPERFRWSAVRDGDRLALLTLDGGTAAVHVRDAGAATWRPGVPLGPGESVLAAGIIGSGIGDDAWRAVVLRPALTDSTLEQYSLRDGDGGVTVSAPVPLSTATPLPGATSAVESCQTAAAVYFVMADRNALVAVRVRDGVSNVTSARLSLPRGARLRLRCDDTQVLATVTPWSATAGAALFAFTGRRGDEGVVLDLPPGGVNEVHAMVLVRDGVLALASTPGALRSWRFRQRAGLFLRNTSRWEHGALLLDLVPGARSRRRVLSMQAESDGDNVTVLMELAQGARAFRAPPAAQPMAPLEEAPASGWSHGGRAVMISRDGGRSFAAPY